MPSENGVNTGQIIEIKGVVIDAVFPDRLPQILHAVEIAIPRPDGTSATLVAEVQQHLGDDRVRAVAMDSTDGLARGAEVRRYRGTDLGTRGRHDARPHLERARSAGRREACATGRRALVDPSGAACVPRAEAVRRGLRNGDQGHRPDRAVHQGRQGRPLRRCRSRQDGHDHGVDPQRRQCAQRCLRVRRGRRADARGQRSLPRDGGIRRSRQGRARLRPDERATRRPPPRRTLGVDDGRVLPRAGAGRAALHRQHLPLRAGRLGGLRASRPDAERRRLSADPRDRDGPAAGAHHVDAHRFGHVGAGGLRPRRRPHRPRPRRTPSPTSTPRRCCRARSWRRGSTRPSTRSTRPRGRSRPASSPTSTTRLRRRCSRFCSATRTCRTSSRSSGWTSSPTRTSSSSRAPARSSASSRSPTSWPSSSPARPGKYVKLEDTIKGFQEIIAGMHDDLPEAAFYMVGPIEEVVEKARQLEQVAA